MAPFPAWMGSYPYSSSYGSSTSSTSISTTVINIDQLAATSSHSVLRRRSPGSSFGYFKDINAQNTYRVYPGCHEIPYSPNRFHNNSYNTTKPKSKPATPMTEITKFFQREWKCISWGRLMQSRIAAFSSGPVIVIGSVALLSSFLESRERSRSEKMRAAQKEGEDWGDGFQ